MKIYIDNDFKCYVANDGTMREFDVPEFDGKCAEYVEGYLYVPYGDSWTRSDGVTFHGKIITPWKPYSKLDTAQREYERELLAEYAEALKVVGVTV